MTQDFGYTLLGRWQPEGNASYLAQHFSTLAGRPGTIVLRAGSLESHQRKMGTNFFGRAPSSSAPQRRDLPDHSVPKSFIRVAVAMVAGGRSSVGLQRVQLPEAHPDSGLLSGLLGTSPGWGSRPLPGLRETSKGFSSTLPPRLAVEYS